MNTPLVSIIMPAHNSAEYIGEAVSSVISQVYSNWELIIVDDCSSDNTGEEARKSVPADLTEKVRVLRNEKNLGAAGSRNRGVKEAHGEWIAFLDSDDAWSPDKLQKQVELLGSTGSALIFTGSAFMDEKSRPLPYVLHVPQKVSYRKLLQQNIISCSSVLLKKSIYLSYPMPECGGIHEDFVSWLLILKNSNTLAEGIDEPLLIYRVSASSKSGNKVKAAKLNWRVYRHIGLSFPEAVKYELLYALNGIRKWNKIQNGK